ncbi:hypothetical protein BGX34_004823, partial [Mortierella sp. NVP85]
RHQEFGEWTTAQKEEIKVEKAELKEDKAKFKKRKDQLNEEEATFQAILLMDF